MKYNAFADEAGNTIDEQISVIKKHKLDGIEIRFFNGTSILEVDEKTITDFAQRLKKENIIVWALASPIGKVMLDTDIGLQLKLLERGIYVAKKFDTSYIRIFSFFPPCQKSEKWNLDQVVSRIKNMVELAENNQVHLCLENEKGTFAYNAENCLYLFKKISKLRGVFDAANFIACHQDTWEAWNKLKPYIEYLHIKDALADGTIVLPGAGVGNLKLIYHDFLKNGGKGVTIEPHLKKLSFFDNMEKMEKSKIIDSSLSQETIFDMACKAFFELVKRSD